MFEDKINRNGLSELENTKNRIDKNMNHLEPFSFSALHFLRNRLLPSDLSQCYNLPSHSNAFQTQALPPLETILPLSKLSMQSKISSSSDFSSNSPSRLASKSPIDNTTAPMKSPMNLGSNSIFCNSFMRRPRGEKRPIPEEQKDEKYFERRKRNNEAAKKSRDARKMREDRIALRAAILEQENSILRAQSIALREEVCTLRQILCNSRTLTSASQA